jgi:Na+/H+-dicarboxylate symporter
MKGSEVTMSKLLAMTASLKATLTVASFAFARGDMLPVILISAFFNLAAQRDAKPVRQTVRHDTMRVPPRDQRSR